jgi:hypothetical protein
MDLESRSLPAEQSKSLQVKVKEYRADLSVLKEQVKTASAAQSGGDAARAELVSCQLDHCLQHKATCSGHV